MSDLEFTSSSFDASHRGQFADELHGHTWHVRIFWPAEPIIDARLMLQRLNACLSQWDHCILDGKVTPTNYGVAKAVGARIAGLSMVEVWREGRVPCGARWINQQRKDGQPQSPAWEADEAVVDTGRAS